MNYTNSTLTWQAHSVMKVEQKCVNSGKFPNGRKMTAKDIQDSLNQIAICKSVLAENGINIFENKQLTLF